MSTSVCVCVNLRPATLAWGPSGALVARLHWRRARQGGRVAAWMAAREADGQTGGGRLILARRKLKLEPLLWPLHLAPARSQEEEEEEEVGVVNYLAGAHLHTVCSVQCAVWTVCSVHTAHSQPCKIGPRAKLPPAAYRTIAHTLLCWAADSLRPETDCGQRLAATDCLPHTDCSSPMQMQMRLQVAHPQRGANIAPRDEFILPPGRTQSLAATCIVRAPHSFDRGAKIMHAATSGQREKKKPSAIKQCQVSYCVCVAEQTLVGASGRSAGHSEAAQDCPLGGRLALSSRFMRPLSSLGGHFSPTLRARANEQPSRKDSPSLEDATSGAAPLLSRHCTGSLTGRLEIMLGAISCGRFFRFGP